MRFAVEQEQADERNVKVTMMRIILRDVLIIALLMLKLLVVFFTSSRSEPRIERLSQEEPFWTADKERMLFLDLWMICQIIWFRPSLDHIVKV